MPFCAPCHRHFPNNRALQQHRETSSAHSDDSDDSYDSSNEEPDYSEEYKARNLFCGGCQVTWNTWSSFRGHLVYNRDDPHHAEFIARVGMPEYQGPGYSEEYKSRHLFCERCQWTFDDWSSYRRHNANFHDDPNDSDYIEPRDKEPYCHECRRFFRNEHDLDTHLCSSIHASAVFLCPGAGCRRRFISEAAVVNHCESGACRSGVNRQSINHVVTSLDRGNIITNPNRLICDYSQSASTTLLATERCWNGGAYECCLCHNEFRSLHALNSHLQSPYHEDDIYRCPLRWGGCDRDFTTLSGLCQHVQSECCGVTRFRKNMRNAVGYWGGGVRSIMY